MSSQNIDTLAVNARVFFHLAGEACNEDSGGNASRTLVGVVFSAIAIESFVNEILERVGLSRPPDEDPRVSMLRTMSVACGLSGKSCSLETKVQVIYAALNGHAIDKGARPYQDFDLLLRVRNAIVHDRPERIFTNDTGGRAGRPESIIACLVAHRVIKQPDQSDVVFPALNSLLEPSVARFAFAAALSMARMIASEFPGSWKQRLLIGFDLLDKYIV